MAFTKILLLFVALFNLTVTINGQTNDIVTICAKRKNLECQQLERTGKFKCDDVYNSVECILDINNGIASFGVITPDEAALAAPLVSDNVVVIGEIRPKDRVHNKTDYDIVVLTTVASGIRKFEDLKGKKLCHPGYGKLSTSAAQLDELIDTVIETDVRNKCSDKVSSDTVLEKKLKATAEYFGSSCKPGLWTQNLEFDKELKERYSSLCSQCQGGSCESKSGVDPFEESLACMVRKGGDIAITTVDAVEKLFASNVYKRDDYRYLCKNDMRSTLDLPCAWSRQSWPLIIANKNAAGKSQQTLKDYLADNLIAPDRTPFQQLSEAQYLKAILLQTATDKINITENIVSLKTFVKEFRDISDPSTLKLCNEDIRWCTTSDKEQEKCTWFAQSYANQGLQPVISCVKANDRLDCLELLRKDTADIVTIPVKYGFIARRKNLTAVAFPETMRDEKIKIMVVVKESSEEVTDNLSGITRFENMKTKAGCFPEYGGIDWFAWVDTARELGVLPKDSCDYGKLTSDFLGDSCLPGANDGYHESTAETDSAKLCTLCRGAPDSPTAENCNANQFNEFFNVTGALKCLNNGGDFAVINARDVSTIQNGTNYRVLCRNNTLAAYPGLHVDEACYLNVVIDSEVVIRRGSSKHNNIKYALEEVEDVFGRQMVKPFELFNSFNKTLHLMFTDSTPGLDMEDSRNEFIRNYIELTSHFDNCVASGKSSSNLLTPLNTLICLVSGIAFYNNPITLN